MASSLAERLFESVKSGKFSADDVDKLLNGALTCVVSEKGAISLKGLRGQNYPLTLYVDQWEQVLSPSTKELVLAFAKSNAKELSRSDDPDRIARCRAARQAATNGKK